jgi:hypothetical protein
VSPQGRPSVLFGPARDVKHDLVGGDLRSVDAREVSGVYVIEHAPCAVTKSHQKVLRAGVYQIASGPSRGKTGRSSRGRAGSDGNLPGCFESWPESGRVRGGGGKGAGGAAPAAVGGPR